MKNNENLQKLKHSVAQELGVNLKEGSSADNTARQNGSVGGYMVKKIIQQYQEKLLREYHR